MTWLTEFFGSYPWWSWLAFYLPALIGSTLWIDAVVRAKKNGNIAGGFGDGAVVSIMALVVLLRVEKHGGPGFLGLQMALMGAIGAVVGKLARWGVPKLTAGWRAKVRAYQLRRSRNPKHVLALCRQRFAQASRDRAKSASMAPDESAAVMGFSEAGHNMLTMLKDLFGLVHDLDDWFAEADLTENDRRRADDIYPEVALERYRSLVGTSARMSVETLGVLRDCARGSIEDIVLFFMRLPNSVREANIYQKAAGIEGWQRLLTEVSPLPETSPSIDTIAEFETGKLQERLLARLAASATRPGATAPHHADQAAVPVREKVRA